MPDDVLVLILMLALGLLYSALIVVLCNKVGARLGVIDHPAAEEHKAHATSTPLVGGIASVPPVISILLVQYFQGDGSSAQAVSCLALALATLGSLFVGFFDDRRHIPAFIRLALSAGIFGAVILLRPEFVVSVLDLQAISLKVELGLLAVPFSVFCILAFQNSVNMADGRNGLVAGIAIIWLLTLLSYGWHPLSFAIVALIIGLLITLGANLGGRLFLGDAGTYGIGAFVGLATIWIHRSNIGLHTIDVAVMFMVPLLDMGRLFFSRLLAGRHPFSADLNHLHHYLDRSIGWMMGRQIYYVLVALPIFAARLQLLEPVNALFFGIGLYMAAIFSCRVAGRI